MRKVTNKCDLTFLIFLFVKGVAIINCKKSAQDKDNTFFANSKYAFKSNFKIYRQN